MPVYNGGKWLRAAVESVLGQTLADLELIIVDDASTDDTARIAEEYVARDCRVRLLRQACNRGQAAARNLALGSARGGWIAPVDADDAIRPDRLRLLTEAGEREHADLIADGVLSEGEIAPGTPPELMTWQRAGAGLERLSALALIKSGTKGGRHSLGYLKPLMRRQFLDDRKLRYAEDLRFAEDFNLYARALFCGARFLLYPESHYVYRQRPAAAKREITRIARQALENSERLRIVMPPADRAELSRALDEYDQRWLLLSWFGQIKREVAGGHVRQLFGLLSKPPARFDQIVRFARDRALLKRRRSRSGRDGRSQSQPP